MTTFGVCNHQHIGPSSGYKYLCVLGYGHRSAHAGDGMTWTHTEGSYVHVTPAVRATPELTQAEVGILLTCLQPVTQFFPELVKKLEGMKQ